MTDSNVQINVSIVVVNWNVAALLTECLASIDRESARADLITETIVVDNHSDNHDHRAVVAAHPDARLVELEENRGYGAACNVGIGLAQGRAVLLLNPDTELLPGALKRLWDTLQLSPHIGLVAPLLLNADGSIQSSGYTFPGPVNVLFDLFPMPARLYASRLNGRLGVGDGRLPIQIDYALGAALLVRRSALLEIGMFDESFFMYSEEVDLQRRLAERGRTRLLAPSAKVIHHGGQSTGQQADAMHTVLWESRFRYFERWSTPGQLTLIRVIVAIGTRLDDIRHPDRRARNRRTRCIFRGRRMTTA